MIDDVVVCKAMKGETREESPNKNGSLLSAGDYESNEMHKNKRSWKDTSDTAKRVVAGMKIFKNEEGALRPTQVSTEG